MSTSSPILDARRNRKWYPGWKQEFDYVSYEGRIVEVHNVKDLYRWVFERLWNERRDDVLEYVTTHGGPIFKTQEWSGRWLPLDGGFFLFDGYFPYYLLAETQQALDELGLAELVLVKYRDVDTSEVSVGRSQ